MRRRGTGSQSNEGIQGSVTADVLAVGHGARASKTVHHGAGGTPAELQACVASLRQALESLQMNEAARSTVSEDVSKIEEAAKEPEVDRDVIGGALSSLNGKLKMLGLVLTETAGLGEPVRKIVELLRLSAAGLGLG